MGIATSIASGLEVLLSTIKKDLYYDIQDYCTLETAVSEQAFTTSDGSFVSVFELNGIKKIISEREQAQIAQDLYAKLKTSFKHKGHALQFVYSKNPKRTKSAIKDILFPYINEAKSMQMDVDFLFKEKIDSLVEKTCYEDNYLVIWSRPTLVESTIKKEKEELSKEYVSADPYEKAQNVNFKLKSLENKHISFLKILSQALKDCQISFNHLKVYEASNVIKSSINSTLVSHEWSARLPFNSKDDAGENFKEVTVESEKGIIKPLNAHGIVMRKNENDISIKPNDVSYFLYPNLKKQLIPCDFEHIENEIIKVGENYISSMFIDIPQDKPTPFINFIKYVDIHTPFQISFKIEGGGLTNTKLKKALSTIFAWVPMTNNRLIKDSILYYENLELTNDDAITKNGISLNTWANNIETLNMQKSDLFKALQSWGSQTPLFTNDDPYEGFFNTIPAFFPKIVGNNYLDTMETVLFNLPLSRQASIWKNGAIINKTPDGKMIPYNVHSNEQTTWGDATIAKPGSGKSVWANATNFSFCLKPKTSRLAKGKLPLIGIADIGPSSMGLIFLLKSLLPESRQHEVLYHKMTNTINDSINIFDTQLGARYPSQKHLTFITRFLTLLLTPAGGKTPESISDMLLSIIKEMYVYFSDKNNPKMYNKNQNYDLDKFFDKKGIKVDGRTWWYVTDKLFELGFIEEAKIAQRYAVPLLDDITSIALKTESIKSRYSKPMMQTNENMLEYLTRVLGENISAYPLLNSVTKLDLDKARVISLDLNDVAPDGDDHAKKQCGIFYMLARNALSRNMFIDDSLYSILTKFPSGEKYLIYHKERTEEILNTRKRLCYDEYHRTAGIENFRAMVVQDLREGRKWNLSISLISQLIQDFDTETLSLCTSKFVFSGGDQYKEIVRKFDLNSEISDIVRTSLNGPTSEGVPFIAKFETKEGDFTQYLYTYLSPIERWAYSSTREDADIRAKCLNIFGLKNSLQILSKTFPSGSVTKTMEKLSNEGVESPMEYIIKKLIEKHTELVLMS